MSPDERGTGPLLCRATLRIQFYHSIRRCMQDSVAWILGSVGSQILRKSTSEGMSDPLARHPKTRHRQR